MADILNQQTSSGTRPKRKTKKASQRTEVLVALHETEAVLSLSCGAILAEAFRNRSEGDTLDQPRIKCWERVIPSDAVWNLEAGAGYGGVIGFRLSVDRSEIVLNGNEMAISLPIPLSWVVEGLFQDDKYRSLFESRVSAFPDVVLEAVPLRTAPECFDNSGSTSPELHRADDNYERVRPGAQARRRTEDKVAGAIAGMLAGLKHASNWEPHEVLRVWSSVSTPSEESHDDDAFLIRLASSIAGEAPDVASLSFFAALAKRLQTLGTQDGLDPEQFLGEVTQDAKSSCDSRGQQLLSKFESAGKALIAFDPSAPKDLLTDGGSIVLRGCLAFILNPSISRLEGMVSKGRLGTRVSTLALMISGYYTGTTAMPRALKSTPVELLVALGDVIFSCSRQRQVNAAGTQLLDLGGRSILNLVLEGRKVASIQSHLVPPLEAVAKAVEAKKWQPEAFPNAIAFRSSEFPTSCLFVARMSQLGPLEPLRTSLVLESHCSLATGSFGQNLEKSLTVASKHGLSLQISGAGRTRKFIFCIYIIADPVNTDDVDAGMTRLLMAVKDITRVAQAGEVASALTGA